MECDPAGTGWIYQIRVEGEIDPSWSDWFSGLALSVEEDPRGGCQTVLTGRVTDQPALRGLLTRLWDLNLTLVSLNRFPEA